MVPIWLPKHGMEGYCVTGCQTAQMLCMAMCIQLLIHDVFLVGGFRPMAMWFRMSVCCTRSWQWILTGSRKIVFPILAHCSSFGFPMVCGIENDSQISTSLVNQTLSSNLIHYNVNLGFNIVSICLKCFDNQMRNSISRYFGLTERAPRFLLLGFIHATSIWLPLGINVKC